MPEVDVNADRVDDDTDGEPEGAEQLGDPGKRALDAMKARVKAERDRRRALEAELAELKGATSKPSDGETVDVDAIRAQVRAEMQAEVLRERALDKIEAKAARLFADAEDARALLAGRADEFVDHGQVDVEAISEALAELLERKPHLAAATVRGPRTPAPDPTQGSRSAGPPDLDALIAEAEARGDTRAAIALKARKLTQETKRK